MGNENAATAAWRTGKAVRAAVVLNVIPAVYRNRNPAVAFFHYRAQKIARISPAAQPSFCHATCIETKVGRESGFFRRVVKRADNEIFPRVPARPPLESFVLDLQTLRNLGPWNVCVRALQDRQRTGRERARDQSAK